MSASDRIFLDPTICHGTWSGVRWGAWCSAASAGRRIPGVRQADRAPQTCFV